MQSKRSCVSKFWFFFFLSFSMWQVVVIFVMGQFLRNVLLFLGKTNPSIRLMTFKILNSQLMLSTHVFAAFFYSYIFYKKKWEFQLLLVLDKLIFQLFKGPPFSCFKKQKLELQRSSDCEVIISPQMGQVIIRLLAPVLSSVLPCLLILKNLESSIKKFPYRI